LEHTATSYNILHHTATDCNVETRCNTMQQTWATSGETPVTQCNILQIYIYTAPHCNILQHISIHCNTLQHPATHCNKLGPRVGSCEMSHIQVKRRLQHTATHCNTARHTWATSGELQDVARMTYAKTPATPCNTLQHPATPCNILQHPTTHLGHAWAAAKCLC